MQEIIGQPFDPFRNRLSRDLRNDLSESLLTTLREGNPEPLRKTADRYRQRADLGSALADYLEKRLACYQVVLDEAESAEFPDPDLLARTFWNHELFFEFHELLEQRWMRVTGSEKEILQGLIRAAGVFIHRRFGNPKGAAKMAARAREVIEKYRDKLPPGFVAEPLLAALANPAAPPPRFGKLASPSSQCNHTGTGA